jgi:hypothetical protein
MNKNIDSRIILKVIKHGKGKHDIDYLHILSNRKLLRGNKFKSMRDFEDKATIMWIRIHETSKNPYNYKIDWKDFEWELTCSNKLSYDLFINTLNDCIRIDDRDTDFIIEDLDLIKSLRYFESFDKYGLIKTKGKLPLIKWKDENRILSIGRRIYNEINKRIRGEKQ